MQLFTHILQDIIMASFWRHDSSTICDHTTTSLMRWWHCTGCASQNVCSTKSWC